MSVALTFSASANAVVPVSSIVVSMIGNPTTVIVCKNKKWCEGVLLRKLSCVSVEFVFNPSARQSAPSSLIDVSVGILCFVVQFMQRLQEMLAYLSGSVMSKLCLLSMYQKEPLFYSD